MPMSINEIIVYLMVLFMALGAVDRIIGNRFGLGEKFEEGILAMGSLALAMIGIICLAPVLASLLRPVVVPVYRFLGADPAMFAGTILANDMGGAPLARELALTQEAGQFGGLIVGSMLGPTIVFTIPVALGIISKDDRSYLGAGVLAGMITIPIGCIVGGLMMNTLAPEYHLSIITIIQNLIPVIIIAALIVVGLWVAPLKMINGFSKFGSGVTIVITIFTAIAVFEYQTGIKFPLLNIMVEADADGVVPLENGLLTCGIISIVLIGAFPMVEWITRTFGGALEALGKKFGMNEQSSAGLVATLANNIAMFNIMGDVNPKGKLLNVAFAVSAAFVFGDHLGFTAGVNQDMILPMIIGKLVAGVTAFIVANALSGKLLEKVDESLKAQAKED